LVIEPVDTFQLAERFLGKLFEKKRRQLTAQVQATIPISNLNPLAPTSKMGMGFQRRQRASLHQLSRFERASTDGFIVWRAGGTSGFEHDIEHFDCLMNSKKKTELQSACQSLEFAVGS
jgi:hypothetical protein